MKSILRIATVALLLSAGSVTAAPQLHATFGDWKVFTNDNGGQKMCYIASVPVKKTGNYSKRSEPFFLVTQRSAGVDEVSTTSGYPYANGSKVQVSIGGMKFDLFTQGERAWASDEATDNRMVGEMIKSNSMDVRGTSPRKTFSVDTYSLKGFSKAHRDMKARCR